MEKMISKIEPDAINIIDERWKESALKNARFIDEMDVERVLSGKSSCVSDHKIFMTILFSKDQVFPRVLKAL